jgi:hypothetical protein
MAAKHRHSPATKTRAGALLQRGYSAAEVAKLVGASSRSVERWAEDLSAKPIDPVRAVAEEALSTGNLTERLRAAEIMLKIGANQKPQARAESPST